ncbi:MAG: hypothetical protein ACRDV7_01395 [Acidimicrobiia bacterium]
MGSKGSKPRKPSHSQHLPKVGTAPEVERELHAEQHGVVEAVGLGGAPAWVKYIVVALGIVLLALAVFALAF